MTGRLCSCKRTKDGERNLATAAAAWWWLPVLPASTCYDTPFTDVNDDEGTAGTTPRFAKGLGFTGKSCISPRHVASDQSRCSAPRRRTSPTPTRSCEAIRHGQGAGQGRGLPAGKDDRRAHRGPGAAGPGHGRSSMEEVKQLMNEAGEQSSRRPSSLAGLKDGMTISFHHHLRNGDYVLNMVHGGDRQTGHRGSERQRQLAVRRHMPLIWTTSQNGVVTGLRDRLHVRRPVGRAISQGAAGQARGSSGPTAAGPADMRAGPVRRGRGVCGRADVGHLWATAPDGTGRSACGSLGYALRRRHVREKSGGDHGQPGAVSAARTGPSARA